MDPGYELALAYVPMFYFGLGVILSILYWLMIKFLKRKLIWTYFVFLLGNLIWGSLIAIDMAYEIFNF